MGTESNEKKIAAGICISDRGLEHCPYCVDSCEAVKNKTMELPEEVRSIREDVLNQMSKDGTK